ncbi:uncharacterized protein LOC135489595 isoform X2 [Lineus longissimus]|uniref:uncharacterized protein LOC135489595 isoform X2 n=1 Tax=Lineus longissimus TaxID=88925 RepID=UPI00315CB56A
MIHLTLFTFFRRRLKNESKMPRKQKGVQTYGRNAAVEPDAVWNFGARRHVFSDSSESDASANDSLACKENVPLERRDRESRGKSGRLLRNKAKTVSYKDPPDFTPKYVKPKTAAKALKDKYLFQSSFNSSANSVEESKELPSNNNKKSAANVQKKQQKKGKEKKPVDVFDLSDEPSETEIPRDCGAEMAKFSEKFNFSEFDSYSFVISESVSPCVVAGMPTVDPGSNVCPLEVSAKGLVTPRTEPPIKVIMRSAMIETSTPNNAVPETLAGPHKQKQSPTQTGQLTSFNLKDLDEQSPLLQCQVYLDRLSISQVEHASPQLNISHNDSSLNFSGNLSIYKSLQKVTLGSKKNQTSSCASIRSRGKQLDSIAESFDASQDLFGETEILQDLDKIKEDVTCKSKDDAESVHSDKDSSGEESPSRYVSVASSNEQGGSFHMAQDHQESSVFFTPRKTRAGRPFGKSIGTCERPKELDGIGNSLKNILTPVKNPRTQKVISPKSQVLQQCNQDDFINFEDYLAEGEWTECTKIGDGAFGEVFRVVSEQESLAIKIIPIEGDVLVNDEKQKKFEEILTEIVTSRELSDLRYNMTNMTNGFVDVKSVRCLKGRFPDILLDQWDIYHKRKGSENDRPDFFKDDQLHIVFEFADGGRDLEGFQFDNMDQAKSVLHQVAYSLAIAEQELMFEHRDLHWGNILVKPTGEQTLPFVVNDAVVDIPCYGVQATIIDFTLSRMEKDGVAIYLDIADDDALFTGPGNEDFQFEVYRMMQKVNGNSWREYHPITNVYWMMYLIDKLMKRKTYINKSQPMLRKFRSFHRNLVDYKSVFDIITDSQFFD